VGSKKHLCSCRRFSRLVGQVFAPNRITSDVWKIKRFSAVWLLALGSLGAANAATAQVAGAPELSRVELWAAVTGDVASRLALTPMRISVAGSRMFIGVRLTP
jgi:hypothetical protein